MITEPLAPSPVVTRTTAGALEDPVPRIGRTLAVLGAVALVGLGGAAVAEASSDNDFQLASGALPAAAPPAPAVPAERAGTIARDHVGGGCIDEIELEGAAWKVEIDRDRTDHEVWVDSTTGAVSRAEQKVDDDGETCNATPEIDDRGDD
jgi:hypothetical protein